MPVCIEADAFTDEMLEAMVNEDIAKFDAYFQSLGNDPLSNFEKAAIKTYMHWKTHGEPSTVQTPVHGETNGESDGTQVGG